MQPQKAFSIEEYEKIDPIATVSGHGRQARFAVPNAQTLGRVNTLYTKEPDTMAWLDNFAPGAVLVDIGANVGMYTIWAAAMRDAEVYAFEPESQNYALLNKNIFINNLSQKVKAYPIAISDTEGFSELNLSHFMTGGSCHTFGEAVDFHLRPFIPGFCQGSYATTLDKLIQQQVVPMPDHIKIDVDGIEHKVIAGCQTTLANPRVQSALIELNTHLELHRELINHMQSLGYGLSEEQLAVAIRTSGPFSGVGNHIFRRDLAS